MVVDFEGKKCQVIVDIKKWKQCGKPATHLVFVFGQPKYVCEEHFLKLKKEGVIDE